MVAVNDDFASSGCCQTCFLTNTCKIAFPLQRKTAKKLSLENEDYYKEKSKTSGV